MNTKQIGNITEVEVMLAFLKQGYNVLTPYGDCERYDFVVDVKGKFIRIQVKTAHLEGQDEKIVFCTGSSHRVEGKCVNHTYTKDEIDYFATSCNGTIYLIPIEEVSGRSKSLRLLPPNNGQIKGISYAKDYILEEVIKSWS